MEAGTFPVELLVEDKYGCTDSTGVEMTVRPVYNIYVPNAFSPNEDDVNDRFRAFVYCPLDQFELKVFDRWGEQVFESKDINQGWDGLKNGDIYEPGVYAWYITYVADGQKQILSGDVTLVK